ncbi:MAG: FtsL-like putative cell division protein [Bacteroidales bacterium]|jgi:hypothetical protein|nr:FtsL-like putative cell division protein [Bacteroidales bacterium]MDD2824451.1 FtsL-like putative cell division protein [Bacteroidales bacterium]MDD3100218.1 FtsL-like putative cell division protein [Bacteroidales bacterium]MDD3638869.1 FtsL-like putative cell division protein [Bacteroidales bacterium]MDD3943170.1 FtsL-like putative cell division protein [Bacteroidales bacterium]
MRKGEQIISTLLGGRILLEGILSKHLKFILYIFLLLILYISMYNAVERTLLANYRLEKELQLLHAEYTRKSADLMRLSQQQEIEKQLKAKGSELQAPQNPPAWIKSNP